MNTSSKNIIWLVSYPKSGNTWVRIFLKYVLGEDKEENNEFPSLHDFPIVSSRIMMDRLLGVSSSNLTTEEIRDLLPAIYREYSSQQKSPVVIKVHDSFGTNSKGECIFPGDVTRAAIYIVRNPLDVVVSYSFHSGKSFQDVINNLNDSSFKISKNVNALKSQVCQHLGTWSEHVSGWTDQKHIPVIFITFEQLLENAPKIFRNLLNRLDIPFSEEKFKKALRASNFTNLKRMEASYGFREKPLQSDSFFREGNRDSYIKYLDNDQIKNIVTNHSVMMKKLGYLNV